MTQKNEIDFLIVGSGLPGIVIASLLIARGAVADRIMIVEATESFGGQYKSISTKSGKTFDLGMHMYYETQIPEIDSIILESLPKGAWNIFEENKRDLAGIIYDGKIRKNSPYPDLRGREEKQKWFEELLGAPRTAQGKTENSSAEDILIDRFGTSLTREVFEPILQNVYGRRSGELHPVALNLTKLDRVVMFSEEQMNSIIQSPDLRSVLAWPEQRTLPQLRKSLFRAMYPKEYGFGNVIHALMTGLKQKGVVTLSNAVLTEMKSQNGQIATVTINGKENYKLNEKGKVFWGGGPIAAAKLLKLGPPEYVFELGIKSKKYIYVELSKPVFGMEDLYYLYNFDALNPVFRVTNYSAYCPNLVEEGRFPICIEYWGESKPEEKITKDVRRFLFDTLKVDKSSVIEVEVGSPIPFPDPTVSNVRQLKDANKFINSNSPKNFFQYGTFVQENEFFLHEILQEVNKLFTQLGDLD